MMLTFTRSRAVAERPAKPPRLTFAGVCIYCGVQGCRSTRCVAVHARSRWGVCDECDGQALIEDEGGCCSPCCCYFGLMEVA